MCPCGGRGDPALECSCSSQRLSAYREKLSRALLDRFDLAVAMPRPRAAELAAPPAEASEPCASAFATLAPAPASPPRRTDAASELLSSAVDRLPLSGRGRARVARVAGRSPRSPVRPPVEPAHVAEALSYRMPGELSRRDGDRCLRRRDAVFPPLLAAIHDPPATLYLRGSAAPDLLDQPAVAVVGARVLGVRPVGGSLARAGSRRRARGRSGMARGIDGEAHRGALEGGGPTVAVLGCGSIATIRPRTPSSRAGSRRRSRRVRVRAGHRAGAVALPRPEQDHRRACAARPSSSRRASEAER